MRRTSPEDSLYVIGFPMGWYVENLKVGVLLLGVYIHHRIRLKEEAKLLVPLGEMVEVDGNEMSVYVEGTGERTLVFMSGGGTCSPILDFKSLYSLLSDEYRVVVVEKFGYGFSDVVDRERDIDAVLEDTRAARVMLCRFLY